MGFETARSAPRKLGSEPSLLQPPRPVVPTARELAGAKASDMQVAPEFSRISGATADT